ncbi:MAG TPA: 50S ribosomal protein L29 [candidate division Zixibacteria bacterium]|nr:50S ribosomal protein L29 [candidate division Zixibacteria bacterium]
MKIVSLRDMTRDELLQKRHELKDEYFNLKMRKSLKELDNPLKLRTLRRDIARIETILTEDKKDIRKIVDSKVSILDRKTDAKAESSSEEGK